MMADPTYANIILELTNQIDGLTNSYIKNGYASLSSVLLKPFASVCILYFILSGYKLLQGSMNSPSKELFKGVIRIGLIYMLLTNWGIFSSYFIKLFVTCAEELGAVLMYLVPSKIPVFSGTGTNGGLQSVFTEVIRVGTWTIGKASLKHFAPVFTGLMIYLCGLAVVGLALFETIIAKLMLSICLSLAPLFFIFTLFEQTKTFFDRWLGVLTGFSLVLIFVSSIVGLSMHLIHWTIGGHYATHAVNISASDWIPLFFVACLCVMAILEVTSIAKSIGGSFSSSNGSAMVGGFIGGAMGAGFQGKSLGKKALNLAKMAVPGGVASQIAQGLGMKGKNSMDNIRHQMRGQ